MSKASQAVSKIIESKADLIKLFESWCTPADKLVVGVEYERPPYYLQDNTPVPYEGRNGRAGLRQFFEALVKRGWQPVCEGESIVGLEKEGVNFSLEPGGQVETGGAPRQTVHEISDETDAVLAEAAEVGQELGIGFVALGYHPTHTGAEMPIMPHSRFEVWRNLFKTLSEHGLDSTSCTSTVQVNLDFQSEADMIKMLRVALSLQPIAASLWANSPLSEGAPSGYQSYRSHLLHNELEGRYGFIPPFVFEKDFGFEKFVDYAMSLPLLGVYTDGVFMDVKKKGMTFGDFMEKGLDGRKATMADWKNHLNTIWPEVRLRNFMEMRGADNGSAEMIKALPAFWVGLLYDKEALNAAYEMVCDWTDEDREYLRTETPRTGLQTPFMGGTVQDIAKNCLALSEAGLKRRNIKDANGNDESVYLAPMHEIADSGKNCAVRLLEKFYGKWKGDVDKVYEEMDYTKSPSVLKPPQPAVSRSYRPPAHIFKKTG